MANAQFCQNPRAGDAVFVMMEHFAHVASGADDGFWTNTFGHQISPRMFGQDKIDVRQVIHNPPIQLLRNSLVKATVSGLHVKDRNLPAFCRNHGQAGVRIAIEKDGIRLLARDNLVGSNNDLTYGFRDSFTLCFKKMVRTTNSKVIEENLVQFEIVVLSGVNKDVVRVPVKFGDHTTHLDEFRPSADYRHDLKHAVRP
ncbi:hypothetical protein MACH21_19320 [Roseicyclus marinus]|uniref:Uncharacterized protein n=1 Tax=Roseicyclus marinus TaxID=2161673 RepID=A0AA48KL39_9RHOB|nr:hypothetical protein MACH21_19320 [Roseicyclus marinus]